MPAHPWAFVVPCHPWHRDIPYILYICTPPSLAPCAIRPPRMLGVQTLQEHKSVRHPWAFVVPYHPWHHDIPYILYIKKPSEEGLLFKSFIIILSVDQSITIILRNYSSPAHSKYQLKTHKNRSTLHLKQSHQDCC